MNIFSFFRNRKASLELSINFIVMLIIAVVVFGFGIYFLSTLGQGASMAAQQISQDSEMQIQALLDSGEQIIVYPEQKEVKRGDSAAFGVGVLNILRVAEAEFAIGVECSSFTAKDGTPGSCPDQSDLEDWTFKHFIAENPEPRTYTVKRNENQMISLPIKASGDATPGTYVFDVYVCYEEREGKDIIVCKEDSQTYPETGGFLKLRVIVP